MKQVLLKTVTKLTTITVAQFLKTWVIFREVLGNY